VSVAVATDVLELELRREAGVICLLRWAWFQRFKRPLLYQRGTARRKWCACTQLPLGWTRRQRLVVVDLLLMLMLMMGSSMAA